ncbi:hypothetical protein BAUCODRAFT_80118 [Baudoinia panamericana UAMH 10762]|uniref:FAD/NAD(P)-binding domain-containing protein n=1 Tax=Baudoinia panamericana (strain UAMH 10762) TaxID=717646 RepID=M2MJ78_BAUPA|nr:uncharacterized protein BAUCODRAFT_80118 [Baudoinia panamericana UAMH 10762]EMC91333.1 hypothetical protein BAUCODRAFT_80118 [Baudoinia panamericana UAMH 10762]
MAAPEKLDFDVVIIGAGISGINFAYRLQERNPELSYTILEGRHEMGGTWSLFKYPGIRSDSDLHTFGFPWRPWEEQTTIAQGPLILKYMKESAAMYGIDKRIQYHHKVENAEWSTLSKTWTCNVTANGSAEKHIRARFILLCCGYYDYDNPLQSVIPGIENFKGTVAHPQFWPEDLDYTDKNVVIVGSGATAITLLPVLAKKAASVTILQRSPSYVLSLPGQDGLDKTIYNLTWWNKPLFQSLIRWKYILIPFLITRLCYYFPKRMRKFFSDTIQSQLPPTVARDPHFNPSYNPFEQRVCFCPDGDFYDALKSGKGGMETGIVETVTPDSIKLTSGKELHPDVIVTATGLRVRFAGGLNFLVDGKPYNIADSYVWKGVMLENLPNAAYVFGYVDASWTLGADATAQLVCRMLKRMRSEGVAEVVPRRSELEKKNMVDVPLLRLTSTYIKRAKDMLPKTGATGQWRPRSYYLQDLLMAKFGDIRTGLEWIRGV